MSVAPNVHNLEAGRGIGVDVTADAVAESEEVVDGAAGMLRAHDFSTSPGLKCRVCEVRSVCVHDVS